MIQTNSDPNQIDVQLICHIDRWLNNINLASVGILHGEDGLNLEVMQNVSTQVVFEQSATASTSTLQKDILQFSSSEGSVECAWTGLEKELTVNLMDQSGKILRSQSLSSVQGQFTWNGLKPGMYFVQFADQHGQQSRQVMVF